MKELLEWMEYIAVSYKHLLDDIRKDNQKLSEEKDILQGVSDRYDRVVRVLGIETVDTAVPVSYTHLDVYKRQEENIH